MASHQYQRVNSLFPRNAHRVTFPRIASEISAYIIRDFFIKKHLAEILIKPDALKYYFLFIQIFIRRCFVVTLDILYPSGGNLIRVFTGANVYDIMRRDTLVLTREAVQGLEARLK